MFVLVRFGFSPGRALVEIGLDVELSKESKKYQHEDAGDEGELPRVTTFGHSKYNDHALDKHHSELKKEI